MFQQDEKNSNISIIFDKQINVDLPTSFIIEIDDPENKKKTLSNDQLSKSGEILIREKTSKFITSRLKKGAVVGAPLCFCPEITGCFTACCAASTPILVPLIGCCVALIPVIGTVLAIVLPIVLSKNK